MSRLPRQLLLVVPALCLAVATGAAQQVEGDPRPGDPREALDPRVATSDPREQADPRADEVVAQDDARTERLTGPALFEALYEQGDLTALSRSLSDAPWQVLESIEALLGRWHSQSAAPVAGQPVDAARAAQAAALRIQIDDLSRLADEALGDTQLQLLASRHFAWSVGERDEYTEGRELFEQAVGLIEVSQEAADLDRAKAPLRRALALLGPLGDVPGQARALLLIGRIESVNGAGGIDSATLEEALRLGRSVRHLDSVWTALGLLYEARILRGDYDGAEAILVEQYQIAHEQDDPSTAQQVMKQLLALGRAREQSGL